MDEQRVLTFGELAMHHSPERIHLLSSSGPATFDSEEELRASSGLSSSHGGVSTMSMSSASITDDEEALPSQQADDEYKQIDISLPHVMTIDKWLALPPDRPRSRLNFASRSKPEKVPASSHIVRILSLFSELFAWTSRRVLEVASTNGFFASTIVCFLSICLSNSSFSGCQLRSALFCML